MKMSKMYFVYLFLICIEICKQTSKMNHYRYNRWIKGQLNLDIVRKYFYEFWYQLMLDVNNLHFKDKNGDRTSRQDKSEKQAVQAKCDQIVDEVGKKNIHMLIK